MRGQDVVRWTKDQYDAYQRKRVQTSGGRVRATDPKPTQGHSLVSAAPGKAKGGSGAAVSPEHGRRRRIRFTVYSVRPGDWDGYHIKELQDLLIKSCILDGDDWNLLKGEVTSEKVYSQEEERTVIEIT